MCFNAESIFNCILTSEKNYGNPEIIDLSIFLWWFTIMPCDLRSRKIVIICSTLRWVNHLTWAITRSMFLKFFNVFYSPQILTCDTYLPQERGGGSVHIFIVILFSLLVTLMQCLFYFCGLDLIDVLMFVRVSPSMFSCPLVFSCSSKLHCRELYWVFFCLVHLWIFLILLLCIRLVVPVFCLILITIMCLSLIVCMYIRIL